MTATQSCNICPSKLATDEFAGIYRQDIGCSGCLRHGHILDKPGMSSEQQEQLARNFASTCPDFAKPRPASAPALFTPQVATGDVSVTSQGPTMPEQQQLVNSCLGCKNYIAPEVIERDWGWTVGGCRAKGILILRNAVQQMARNCNFRAPGVQDDSTAGMFLLPNYANVFQGATNNPISSFMARGGGKIIEPNDYPTDKPVEEWDAAQGIRAWRYVGDNVVGKQIYLPIFDEHALVLDSDAESPTYNEMIQLFSEGEKRKIPRTGDKEHPEWYVDHQGLVLQMAIEWMELDETPALWSEPGVGKTELLRHLAWLMHLPFDRISISRKSDVDDLLGKWLVEGGETVWHDGRIPLRWTQPGVLLLDEPNTGPDEVWQTIRPLTDNSAQLVLDQARGEMRDRNEWCFPALAMNPAHDFKNVGTNVVAAADIDRLVHIAMEMPPDVIERDIIQRWVSENGESDMLPNDVLNKVMSIAADIRSAIKDGTITASWNIRPQIKVARQAMHFDLMTAYRRALADGIDPAERDLLLSFVSTYTGRSR